LLGIASILTGLILLAAVPHPIGYQETPMELVLSVSIILVCSTTVAFGAWLLTGSRIRMFMWPLLIIILWAYTCLVPILLLPLSPEIVPIAIGLSSLPPVLLYLLYVKLRPTQVEDMRKEQK
jgi:hypothetical protein